MKALLTGMFVLITGVVVVRALSSSGAATAATPAGSGQYIQEEGHAPTPTIDPNFGARLPRACPVVTSAPSDAQAVVLVQCTMDYEMRSMAVAHQEISVVLGTPRERLASDQQRHLDVRYRIIPLTANATEYQCQVVNDVMNNAGRNCTVRHYVNSPGECWKTFDSGAYRCQIEGISTGFLTNQPPPTTF